MKTQFIISIKILGIMTLLLGIIYPLFITGIAQACFRDKANGSLIERDGKTVGSALIGQQFDSTIYFTARPSAVGYNTMPSGASNYGLTSRQLFQQVMERKEKFITDNELNAADSIPSEMLFASASGLDPHISPQAAELQINKIARARGFSEGQIQELRTIVAGMTEKPQFGLFGKSRINILLLNLRLDDMKQ